MIAIETVPGVFDPGQPLGYDIQVIHNDVVVSYCHIALNGWHLTPLLMGVNTKPEYQRQGFGHELMRGVEQCLIENKLDHCYLETGKIGHARHLYECHGWKANENVYIGNAPLTMEWRREWIGSTAELFPTTLTCSPSMNASS